MGRNSSSGREPSAGSRRTGRQAGTRARAKSVGAAAGPARRIELTGAMDAATTAALELEIRELTRRYGAELEGFRVKVRRRSG